jgi:hypothetical protein
MQFDIASWTEELHALNSWTQGDGDHAEKRLRAALARHQRGVETWNAWARSMLNSRELLDEAGLWNATRSWDPELLLHRETANGAQTRLWISLATVDFAGRTFSGPCSFRGFVFPGETDFQTRYLRARRILRQLCLRGPHVSPAPNSSRELRSVSFIVSAMPYSAALSYQVGQVSQMPTLSATHDSTKPYLGALLRPQHPRCRPFRTPPSPAAPAAAP